MNALSQRQTENMAEDFLADGGEMGARMRALDWSLTPLGPAEAWPQSLKTSVSICLNSSFALLVWWGKELVMLYNDAYCPIIGNKHPTALGQTGKECWPEIWEIIGPMLVGVLETGKATRADDLFLPLERHGYSEECYFTFSYSPIRDESGGVGGVFTPVQETTEKVIGERRLHTLRDLAAQRIQTKAVEEVCRITAETLAQNPYDIPFACIYLLNEDGSGARLVGMSGIAAETALSPTQVHWESLANDSPLWFLKQVAETGQEATIGELGRKFASLPSGAWSDPPETLLVLPITLPGNQLPVALLVAGVSPMKALDSAYRSFLNLVAGQVAANVAEARAYEEERKRAEALAELDRAKTTFFSNVSHEFRTPLSLILGHLEDLLARPAAEIDPVNRDALTVAHRNGLRLLKLVNTLLDFSRIEAGRVQAIYEPVDLNSYTAELASVFRSTIEKAGMRLIVRDTPLSQPVYVDKEMWEKIVLNLLSNAFKFTEAGEIEVWLEEHKGTVAFSVRDTGVGIPEEQLPHIFERFHRVEGTRSRTHEGTGIGLALVQELVHLHGGTVSVESVPGRGSTFTVSLPSGTAHLPAERIHGERTLASTATGANPYVLEALRWLPENTDVVFEAASELGEATTYATFAEDGDKPRQRRRILLADDNADMREYVSRLLADYEVIAVPDGEAALKAVQERRPDLVLSDVMMPNMDGFALLQALRSDVQTRTLPVILLSARAGEEAQVEGLSAQADDYLTKPFSAKELRARVAAHLEMARVRKEAEQDRERLLEELEVERTRLTEIFMRAPAFIAVLRGPEHIFERVNPPYSQLIGHRDVLGKTVREALPEVEGQGFFEILDQVYQTGKPFIGRNMRIFIQWGADTPLEERYLDFVYQPLVEVNGSISGIFVHGVDLTERRCAELTLQERAREIETLNARLKRSMTETHHRVKNNLQLISALIEMQRATGEETVPMSELLRLGANVHALGVIHDILTQEAKAGSDQETLSSKAVFERLIQVLKQTTGDRPLVAELDEVRLTGKQTTTLALVTNELVSNSLKHGKGTIKITFRLEGDMAILEVCDEGPGFPADFNAEMATNTGLELVENIVEWDLRGQIFYGNRAEGGAQVRVTFPIFTYRERD